MFTLVFYILDIDFFRLLSKSYGLRQYHTGYEFESQYQYEELSGG